MREIVKKALEHNVTPSEMVALAPPATVQVAAFLGVSWHDWVFILTALYTLVMIVVRLMKCSFCIKQNGTCPHSCK